MIDTSWQLVAAGIKTNSAKNHGQAGLPWLVVSALPTNRKKGLLWLTN
jgi:hypothetical protein